MPAYEEMFLQISRDYTSLPNIKELTIKHLCFYYEGLRNELKEATKPK